ncbi:TIGR04197 family type VII secretion effector [Heyndrickxia coagulans]|uniref:TIGR04197 family type VII secretion effector n=1 Tax=Heyndrickxia coagulans TaxID=1398 RepID=UPI002E21D6FA|nr:TIGR04197 family type VII secretion effector [Heyndrickxia coagulans]
MGEIAINQTVFRAVLSQADSTRSTLEGIKPVKITLQQTDLKSMREQLEIVGKLQNTLKLYSALLDADLRKLEQLGNEMVQQDDHIGQSFHRLEN